MSTAVLAFAVAVAALLAAGAVAVLVLSSRRAAERRLTEGLVEVGARMDGLARELALAVERVREDAVRARIVESLGQPLELDEVLARCAEAAVALPGVAGAVVAVELDGAWHTASAGVEPPGAAAGTGAPLPVAPPPGDAPVRAIGISYHYRAGEAPPDAWRSAVAVPLESAGRVLGPLTVFGHDEEPPVTGDAFATLEEIARQAGPAIDRAHVRGTTAGVPPKDALTGLGTRAELVQTLAVEVARAQRQEHRLALVLLDVRGASGTGPAADVGASDALVAAAAEGLRATIGPDDLVFRSGAATFSVVMPGAGRIEGEALHIRLQASLGPGVAPATARVDVAAGIAELKPDDDGVSLYERAERDLRRREAAREE